MISRESYNNFRRNMNIEFEEEDRRDENRRHGEIKEPRRSNEDTTGTRWDG